MKLTLGEARTRLSESAPPAKLSARINESCELLVTLSSPKDAIERVAITAHHELLTLPRQYAACLGVIRNKVPLPVRNGWVEFVLSGAGQVIGDDQEIHNEAVDIGDGYCCYKEPYQVNVAGCRIKFVTDALAGIETPDAVIEIYGHDVFGNDIRTVSGSDARYGEIVDLNTGSGNVTTTNSFCTIRQIVKPRTRGVVSIYAINPDDSSENLIGTLAPGETSPSYRRYSVPKDPEGQDAYVLIALCRRRYVEALEDNDVLSVSNINALRGAMLALHYRDENDDDRYSRTLTSALDMLGREASHFKPNSQRPPMINFIEEGGVRMTAFY